MWEADDVKPETYKRNSRTSKEEETIYDGGIYCDFDIDGRVSFSGLPLLFAI